MGERGGQLRLKGKLKSGTHRNYDGEKAERHHAGSLPKRETLCLTKAANLQKILRLEERGTETGRRKVHGEENGNRENTKSK